MSETNETSNLEVSPEEMLENARKQARNADLIWRVATVLSLAITFSYLIFLYWGHLLSSSNIMIRIAIGVGLLILIFVCVYILPVFLKTQAKYRRYSVLYKNTYLKPYLEESFKGGEYEDYSKVSIKELTEFSLFKKSRSAEANDCVFGTYKGIDFKRYDLALRYKKSNSTSDCVLIVCNIKTKLKDELQIIENNFKLGGESYEQPENLCKILSGSDRFDKKYDVYAENQSDGEKFLRNNLLKRFTRLAVKGSIAAFFDKKRVYLVIRRKKDVMEAPLYRKVDRKRCEKEADIEVDIIKEWIDLLHDCI